MLLVAQTLSVLLAVAMLATGASKLRRTHHMTTTLEAVNVRGPAVPLLGFLQVAGAAGLIAGLWLPALGISAAAAFVLLFVGAITAHVHAHDPNWQGAAAMLLLSIATLTLLTVQA